MTREDPREERGGPRWFHTLTPHGRVLEPLILRAGVGDLLAVLPLLSSQREGDCAGGKAERDPTEHCWLCPHRGTSVVLEGPAVPPH